MSRRISLLPALIAALAFLAGAASAFAPLPDTSVARSANHHHQQQFQLSALPSADLLTTAPSSFDSTVALSAATVDPTAFLSGLLGGLINSPAILLVPIGAGVLVASLVAWFIISYANPADEDD